VSRVTRAVSSAPVADLHATGRNDARKMPCCLMMLGMAVEVLLRGCQSSLRAEEPRWRLGAQDGALPSVPSARPSARSTSPHAARGGTPSVKTFRPRTYVALTRPTRLMSSYGEPGWRWYTAAVSARASGRHRTMSASLRASSDPFRCHTPASFAGSSESHLGERRGRAGKGDVWRRQRHGKGTARARQGTARQGKARRARRPPPRSLPRNP
jgi:hypothetical protein